LLLKLPDATSRRFQLFARLTLRVLVDAVRDKLRAVQPQSLNEEFSFCRRAGNPTLSAFRQVSSQIIPAWM
jgi:hypothetical protein